MAKEQRIRNKLKKDLTEEQAYRYTDASCKQFLGDKLILACILKTCVQEFKDCHVNDIETKYIEGEPEIGTIGLHPETTNHAKDKKRGTARIHGINAESASDTEGTVTFDIRFYALTPTNERVKLIINVESQNEFYPGYPLIRRAIYYGCRQISAQYGPEFDHSHYEKIKKVYSIWICFDPPGYRRNTITKYSLSEDHIVGEVCETVEDYDLMCIVMICLGTAQEERYTGLLKLLGVFMSEAVDTSTKTKVLRSEFGADMPERLLEKEVNMCNYSEFIKNKGIKEGLEAGLKEGKAVGLKEGKAESLIELMNNFKLSIEQALTGLSIPKSEWDEYKKLVEQMNA